MSTDSYIVSMINNTEPICGVCRKLLTMRENKYHCDGCEKFLKGIEKGDCEICGTIFLYHTKLDKDILSNFFDGSNNRSKKIKIWRDKCPTCRKADKAFSEGKLADWIWLGLESGTTKELIQLVLEKENPTQKDILKLREIPEELLS